jgi:hypothetical protein
MRGVGIRRWMLDAAGLLELSLHCALKRTEFNPDNMHINYRYVYCQKDILTVPKYHYKPFPPAVWPNSEQAKLGIKEAKHSSSKTKYALSRQKSLISVANKYASPK